ncbi:allantoinase PuuE [Nocardia sp. CNY236]|uniref:allantoinase PuuE n=1 Tax=Nocardia sp. CNY236 TaxID=1169152 RepID=UPI000428731F|nr:allantoinase PuuE [Nocardia sp. CNY236]
MSDFDLAYPRDMVGYGPNPPHPHWPDDANLAVQFVLNYEEGAENCVLDGDPAAESLLSDVVPMDVYPNRNLPIETMYEYGSRAGLWRVLRAFATRDIPLTIFAVARALERNPAAVHELKRMNCEVACHSLRWISYQTVDPRVERQHIDEAVQIITRLIGEPPRGWFTGRVSPQTRELVVEHGGFAYDADSYADDLPYWVKVNGQDHLVVPYTLEANDMKFTSYAGFATGEEFFSYLKDAFDVLYAEGVAGAPKMLSVGLHCRLSGRPARTAALQRFLDYVQSHDKVWMAQRIDIANHWAKVHPPN